MISTVFAATPFSDFLRARLKSLLVVGQTILSPPGFGSLRSSCRRVKDNASCLFRRPIRKSVIHFILLSALAGTISAFPATYNVREFGAAGDGATKDTAAFQKALDTCAVNGGGDVVVPAGNYLIGSIQLGQRTSLRLEKDSIIAGSPDLADYPMIDVRWEGRWQPGHRALIYAANVAHTGITGPGRIEGSAAVAASQNPRGVVVLEPINCHGINWEGFTVTQGGNWATHPTFCTDVVIKNVTVRGKRDGIDVDSCSNVRIEDCNIETGDDCISLKSGRGMDGARLGRPTENVLIKNCDLHCTRFAAIGIGSETSGGVRNIRIIDSRLNGFTHAIYIKTRIGRAGVTEEIAGENLDVTGGGFLRINLTTGGNTNTADDPVPGPIGYPSAKNLNFTGVRLHNVASVVDAAQISPEKPVSGLILRNVTGTSAKGLALANMTDVQLHNLNITGFSGKLVTAENCSGIGLDQPTP
jgi:polygalacturonase